MSDGSAIKISKRTIPARLGEREGKRGEREREHAVPPSCSPTAQFCVLFRRQDERQEQDNAHPSDSRFPELRLLSTESGYLRIRHRGREHTAHLELSKKLGKLVSVLHLCVLHVLAVWGGEVHNSTAFTHGDTELDRHAHASGRRMLIGECKAPLIRRRVPLG